MWSHEVQSGQNRVPWEVSQAGAGGAGWVGALQPPCSSLSPVHLEDSLPPSLPGTTSRSPRKAADISLALLIYKVNPLLPPPAELAPIWSFHPLQGFGPTFGGHWWDPVSYPSGLGGWGALDSLPRLLAHPCCSDSHCLTRGLCPSSLCPPLRGAPACT